MPRTAHWQNCQYAQCRTLPRQHVGSRTFAEQFKAQATVKFDVASSKISPEDQEELKTLAQSATALTGYIVEVTGYADSTGSAEMNTRLSEQRAKAVVPFLMQQGGVPVQYIVAPGAMGEYAAATSNETKASQG